MALSVAVNVYTPVSVNVIVVFETVIGPTPSLVYVNVLIPEPVSSTPTLTLDALVASFMIRTFFSPDAMLIVGAFLSIVLISYVRTALLWPAKYSLSLYVKFVLNT